MPAPFTGGHRFLFYRHYILLHKKIHLLNNTTTNYILQNQSEGGLGFYVVDTERTSAANRAYLTYTAPAGAPIRSFFSLASDASAIERIGAEGQQGTVIFNLSGQRLNSLQRGINIVNGKKVFVK